MSYPVEQHYAIPGSAALFRGFSESGMPAVQQEQGTGGLHCDSDDAGSGYCCSMGSSEVAAMWVAGVDEAIAPRMTSAALLIIDTQVDFVDGGASPVAGTAAVVPQLVSLQAAFRAAGRPVVHVVRIYAGDDVDRVRRTALAAGTRLVTPDSDGAQVVPQLRGHWDVLPGARPLLDGEIVEVATDELVLWKPRWSAFHRTGLHALLAERGIDTTVVVGCNFPNCPRATIYDSSERDYRVLVPSDAVSGLTVTHLAELGGIGALHAQTASIVGALAAHPDRPRSTQW